MHLYIYIYIIYIYIYIYIEIERERERMRETEGCMHACMYVCMFGSWSLPFKLKLVAIIGATHLHLHVDVLLLRDCPSLAVWFVSYNRTVYLI